MCLVLLFSFLYGVSFFNYLHRENKTGKKISPKNQYLYPKYRGIPVYYSRRSKFIAS